MLASPSNHEVFEADPHVSRVHVAERTWFERHPDRWGLVTAVWSLGRSLRGQGYDLGIDVRGDVLSVLVLALAGVPRRVGWAMGGGAFLLTDVATWVRGRHEVRSRLALLERLGIAPDEPARVDGARPRPGSDRDRPLARRSLAPPSPRRLEVVCRVAAARHDGRRTRTAVAGPRDRGQSSTKADWLHADRFSPLPPLLAVHLGAGNAAKRWPRRHWKVLIERFLESGWRVIVVGGLEDLPCRSVLEPHDRLRDWTGHA